MTPSAIDANLADHGVDHPDPFVLRFTVTADQVSSVVPHVDNVAVIRWLDRAAELHAAALGWPRTRLLDENIMWFVGRHEVDYLAEASEADELIVATWVRDIRRVKSWRDYVIVRPSDNRIICRAATLWVLVDLSTRRTKAFTPEMIEQFAPLRPARAPGSRRAADR